MGTITAIADFVEPMDMREESDAMVWCFNTLLLRDFFEM